MSRSRIKVVTLGAPVGLPSEGMLSAASWLRDRGVDSPGGRRWHFEVSLSTQDRPASPLYDDRIDTRFHIDIYSEEWGFFFCHGGRASWIRFTDVPFVHGRDDFALLAAIPPLVEIGGFLRNLEAIHQVVFRREHALIRTNLPSAAPVIRRWVESL
jgi:hypothetical protein